MSHPKTRMPCAIETTPGTSMSAIRSDTMPIATTMAAGGTKTIISIQSAG